MDQKLKAKIDLMARNDAVVRKSAKLDFNAAAHLAALLFTEAGREADEATIRANRSLLKTRAGIFSNMRAESTNLAVLANMSMADDSLQYMNRVFRAYDVITEGKVYRDENLVFTAMNMAESLHEDQFQAAAQETWAILAKMRSLHPLLTSQDDMTLAFLLSQSDIDIDELLNEAEQCYEILKGNGFFLNKDTLQSVSLLLALSDKPIDQKCNEFQDLRAALKAAGHRVGYIEQAIIAAFVDVDVPVEQLVSEISEADDYLKKQKGFGLLRCGIQLRRMLACALVLQTHNEEKGASFDAGKTVAAYVAQQIIAIIITIIIITSINTSRMLRSN